MIETNGSGSCTGLHTYTAAAVYSVGVTVTDKDGDAASGTVRVAVSLRATTTTVSFSPNPVVIYSPVTVTVKVNDSDNGAPITPTGIVKFSSTETSDGTGECTLSAGSCSWSFTPVVPNQLFIAASYAGDANHFPSNDSTEDAAHLMVTADLLSQRACISAPFNGTPITGGNKIWFNSVFQVAGKPTKTLSHLTFYNQTIQIGLDAPFAVPDAAITFDPDVSSAETAFDATTNTWLTTFPASHLAGRDWLSGVEFTVPNEGLPGGVKPVTWCGNFSSDSAAKIGWDWAAAVYTQLNSDLNALGVKPVDDPEASIYQNANRAGTPENDKSFVIAGARGGGGKNFTGGYSKDEETRLY